MSKPLLRLLLAAPRGFCAGVDRAIKIVELALQAKTEPVYVRHEIVHNRHVVRTLEEKGAVFVEELHGVPDGATVVFSAHGVPKTVPLEAGRRGLGYLDATCPLVSKVHREAERHHAEGRHILLLGHEGHPEVVGTMGQLPAGTITLLEDLEAAQRFLPPPGRPLAYITQTTLSVDDTAEMITALRERFPDIVGPRKEDICYATSNRQAAVKAIARKCDALIVVGAPNSSNSRRLVEVAQRNGCEQAWLVQRAADIDWSRLGNCRVVGLTAGASAPESLVQEVADAFRQRYAVEVEEVRVAHENIEFKLPREVRPEA